MWYYFLVRDYYGFLIEWILFFVNIVLMKMKLEDLNISSFLVYCSIYG